MLIVSATNVDLGQAVASRRFRADLLYRLNTMHVTMPSLSERNDVIEIARFLLTRINPQVTLSERAIAALVAQRWQGNIRELRGVLARMSLAAAENGNVIDEGITATFLTAPAVTQPQGAQSLRELQKAQLRSVYAETGGNISETARRLGVCRNTVYRALEGDN